MPESIVNIAFLDLKYFGFVYCMQFLLTKFVYKDTGEIKGI